MDRGERLCVTESLALRLSSWRILWPLVHEAACEHIEFETAVSGCFTYESSHRIERLVAGENT
jgi:hypothetical protein